MSLLLPKNRFDCQFSFSSDPVDSAFPMKESGINDSFIQTERSDDLYGISNEDWESMIHHFFEEMDVFEGSLFQSAWEK
jgi:hypothetical protein